MEPKKRIKESFVVIGKEGSTNDGVDFIQKLWEDANSHFNEIKHLVKKDGNGNICGIWGVMSDFSRSFRPWENGFAEGLYLAGAECMEETVPPKGWVKWIVPAYEYLCFNCDEYTFSQAIDYLRSKGLSLAGAAHDFTDPLTGKVYIYTPIKKL